MCVYVNRYIADHILYMYQCLMCAYYIRYWFCPTCNALSSIQLCLMLFRAILVLLIPNTTVNCAITYTNRYIDDPILYMYQCLMCAYYIRYWFCCKFGLVSWVAFRGHVACHVVHNQIRSTLPLIPIKTKTCSLN